MAQVLFLTEDSLFFFLAEDGSFFLELENNVPTITRLRPVPRNTGLQIPNLIPTADWCDSRSLAAGVAEAITPPVDAVGAKATIFRLNSTAGPLYINFNGTATVPAADTTNGTSAIMVHSELHPVLVTALQATESLSIICAANSIVTIEAWS